MEQIKPFFNPDILTILPEMGASKSNGAFLSYQQAINTNKNINKHERSN